jgi:hypothetical protein
LEGSLDKSKLDRFLQELLWGKNIANTNGEFIDVLRLKVLFSLLVISSEFVMKESVSVSDLFYSQLRTQSLSYKFMLGCAVK